jgi:proteasome assembly chaperone (PAC2) family protein
MEHLRWSSEPNLRRPIILAAFEGWNDAGDAATTAVRFLGDRWQARAFADIDAEPFYNFTQSRPMVELADGQSRRLVWPRNRLSAAAVKGLDGDVIVLDGTEPSLMWRTFCEQVIGVAQRYDAQLVITMGALLSDVPHTRPTQIFGSGYDAESIDRFDVEPSTYEGPTGIVGVLHAACRDADLPSASLWAAVPSYLRSSRSPKAALALVSKVGEMLGIDVPTTDLEIAAAAYERQVSQLVEDDEETLGLVRQLEERYDEMGNSGALVEEVEQFLRGQSDD